MIAAPARPRLEITDRGRGRRREAQARVAQQTLPAARAFFSTAASNLGEPLELASGAPSGPWRAGAPAAVVAVVGRRVLRADGVLDDAPRGPGLSIKN